MTNNQNKKEEGLPDIAQKIQKKNSIVLIVIGIVLLIALSFYFHAKSKIKPAQPIEESYTIENRIDNNQKMPPKQLPPTDTSVKPRQEITPEQIAFIQEKQRELRERLSAPLMLINSNGSERRAEGEVQAPVKSNDPNTQFMNQVSEQKPMTATATTIGPLNTLIAEGNFIHGILESATNSDLPGFLRASVNESVYSEDGTQVLIPRGSRLIGQYKSGMLHGQSRIFIVWTRLITPTGISIQLNSPGVDSLGVTGMGADEINRHFWERFGTASLLSIIGAGTANLGVSNSDQENSVSVYRSAMANSFAQSANQSLQQESMIAPTLKNYQGRPIMVFVGRDLHFAGAMQQVKPKINVF
jgi:type IV secretion system protein VirB10